MLKCSSIMYCFDFDGTICDCHENFWYIKRIWKTFKSNVCINPMDFDIRWTIVTNRSFLDKWIISSYCISHGLNPSDIITSNRVFGFKNAELKYQFKMLYFKSVLEQKIKVKYTKDKVESIIYICNDKNENSYINFNKSGYPILSVNSLDFKREFFNKVV